MGVRLWSLPNLAEEEALSGEGGFWRRWWEDVVLRCLSWLVILAPALLIGLIAVFATTLATRIVWKWWGVSHISVDSFNAVMKALPWWPLVAVAFLAVIGLRHRDALDFLIRNLRLKHGDTEVGAGPQKAIDTGTPPLQSSPETPVEPAQPVQAMQPQEQDTAKDRRIEELEAENQELRLKMIYYQLNPESKALLRQLSRRPGEFLSSKELNSRAMPSSELASEIRALQAAGLIKRESATARSYMVTDLGQQVMSVEETEQD